MSTTTSPTLTQYIPQHLRVGSPDVVGPLTVYPLFGPEPRLDYLAFSAGAARGVRVHELSGGASVNDLSVVNPLELGVLLYDGEEVLGAQQNRTFDVSILVPADRPPPPAASTPPQTPPTSPSRTWPRPPPARTT